MAEKKFFVDINLQGSALTNAKIGTNTGIGSTEGAFGYDSAAHRLQYFDGTATKEVANLSDIAAVTGGLILQGGYNAATDTPNITDGSAFKGFFWVVTEAGTFLGEAVQVGDSIIAKVDEAGATLSDWLILQGNVVIATDSVDGISRLATQTEANDGTEAGAVVITPATLQGKIDAQVTPEINSKVSKSGDTMSGNLDMGSNTISNAGMVVTEELTSLTVNGIDVYTQLNMAAGNTITNLPAPTNDGDATNKLYVDNASNDKLPLEGGTMSGNINMGSQSILNIGTAYVNNLNSPDFTSPINLDINIDAGTENTIINLPAPTDGGDATNKTYVDDADALKLDLAGGTMTGHLDMGSNGIQGASFVEGNILLTDSIGSLSGSITVYNAPWDYQGHNNITNLGAPTADGDATNKLYVDGAASTAESNANTYTDTTVAAISGKLTIPASGWVFESVGSPYYYQIIDTSAFGAVITQVIDTYGTVVELDVVVEPTYVVVRSNIQPAGDFYLSVIKVF